MSENRQHQEWAGDTLAPIQVNKRVIFPQRLQLTQLAMDYFFEELEEDNGICF